MHPFAPVHWLIFLALVGGPVWLLSLVLRKAGSSTGAEPPAAGPSVVTPGGKSRLRPLLALLLVTVGLATWIIGKGLPARRPDTLPTPIVNEEYGFKLVLARGWSVMTPALAIPGGNAVRVGIDIDSDMHGFLDVTLARTSLEELTATVRGHLDLLDPTTEAPRQVSFRGQRAVEYSSVTPTEQGKYVRYRSLMFLRGPYLYTLAAGGDPEALTAARAQSFFEAFQFTELARPPPR